MVRESCATRFGCALGNDDFLALATTPFDVLCHHGAQVAPTSVRNAGSVMVDNPAEIETAVVGGTGEAGHRACETAVLTHGGMGYAREFHVERFFREIQIARIAPVSSQLILSHIAERVLGLPKSY